MHTTLNLELIVEFSDLSVSKINVKIIIVYYIDPLSKGDCIHICAFYFLWLEVCYVSVISAPHAGTAFAIENQSTHIHVCCLFVPPSAPP